MRLIFDGHVQPNSSDSPTPAAIIPYVSWYTNYWDEALTPIIVGKTLPSWDMENMTFTIPNDCIFLKQGKAVRPSVLIGASNDTVLNIPTNSSAQKLYFNLSTNEYVWHLWSDVISYPDDLILVAVFRTNQGYSSVGSIAITCPYEIDGKRYGVDATSDIEEIAWLFGENVKGINHPLITFKISAESWHLFNSNCYLMTIRIIL